MQPKSLVQKDLEKAQLTRNINRGDDLTDEIPRWGTKGDSDEVVRYQDPPAPELDEPGVDGAVCLEKDSFANVNRLQLFVVSPLPILLRPFHFDHVNHGAFFTGEGTASPPQGQAC